MFEIHYSGPKSKGFRQCPFEFCQARFTLLKDLKVSHSPIGMIVDYSFIVLLLVDYRITRFTDGGILKTSFGTSAMNPNAQALTGTSS